MEGGRLCVNIITLPWVARVLCSLCSEPFSICYDKNLDPFPPSR